MSGPTSLKAVILRDLRSRENLDAYVAIVLGVVLATLGILGKARFELLASGILLTISFSVWAALANRHAIGELKLYIQQLRRPNPILRFAEFPDGSIKNELRAAKEISLCGLSMYRFFPMYFVDIEEALSKGATLRVLLLDPDSDAVEMASFRSDTHLSVELERQRIIGTINFLRHRISELPNVKIEVRMYRYLAPYSIITVLPSDSQSKGYCHARILPFRTPALRAPLIIPDPDADAAWFKFFSDQFESLWNASSETSRRDTTVPI
jgi:hypothetical protein